MAGGAKHQAVAVARSVDRGLVSHIGPPPSGLRWFQKNQAILPSAIPKAVSCSRPAALLGVQAIVLRNRSTCPAIAASFAINSAERWAKFSSTRLQRTGNFDAIRFRLWHYLDDA
jgi:hypothetical protein